MHRNGRTTSPYVNDNRQNEKQVENFVDDPLYEIVWIESKDKTNLPLAGSMSKSLC